MGKINSREELRKGSLIKGNGRRMIKTMDNGSKHLDIEKG